MGDTPQEAPQKSAFESMYDQRNDLNLTREAKDLIDMVQNLSTSSENDDKNDDALNIANMLGNEFERAINNLKLTEDQAQALIEQLNTIKNNNGTNLAPDTIKGIDDLITLLTPQANPLLGNTININSIITIDNGRTYTLRDKQAEINQILTQFNQINTLFGEGYDQLKTNLNTINNYLNGQSITYQNATKIIDFLQAAGIEYNGTIDDINVMPQLFAMLHTFVSEISSYHTNTLTGHNDVINEYRQQKEENNRATQEQKEDFEEFRNIILREKVSRLDRRIDDGEMANIKEYINGRKIEDLNIVFELYDKMKSIQFNNNGDEKDKEMFNEIMVCLKESYKNEIGERDLNNLLGSKNILDFYGEGDPDQNRNSEIDMMKKQENGEYIKIGSDEYYQKITQGDKINTICRGRDFTKDQFMEKFKEADTARMLNNIQILKNNFDITTLINNEDQFIDRSAMLNNLLDRAADNFKETRGTKFLNDKDALIFIEMLNYSILHLTEDSPLNTAVNEARSKRMEKIDNYINGGHANIIAEPLPALEETSIDNKNLFKGLTAETIANYYTDISGKFNNNQEIKGLLTTLRDGLTSAPNGDGSNDKIRELQRSLGITGNAKDGRFGTYTFGILDRKIQNLLQQSQNSTDTTVNQNPAGSQANGGSVETGQGSLGGQESIEDSLNSIVSKLRNTSLEIPGRAFILNAIEHQNNTDIRTIQLALKPKYIGKIDGKIGNNTIKALNYYISNTTRNNKSDTNVEPLIKSNQGRFIFNNLSPNMGNNSCVTISQGGSNCAYFHDGSILNYTVTENSIVGTFTDIAGTGPSSNNTVTFPREDMLHLNDSRVDKRNMEKYQYNNKTMFDNLDNLAKFYFRS